MLSCYRDHHVHWAITDGLRRRGIDVLTSFDDASSERDDEQVLERATTLSRVVFTQDDDFLVVVHDWLKAGREFAGLVYVHQMRITIGQAI